MDEPKELGRADLTGQWTPKLCSIKNKGAKAIKSGTPKLR